MSTKVKSKNGWENRDVILPFVGKTHFDEKGEAEISNSEKAEQLAAIESLGLEIVGKAPGKSSGKGGSQDAPPASEKPVAKMNRTELMAKIVQMGRDKGEDLSDKKKADLIAIIEMTDEEWNAANEEAGGEVSVEEKINYIDSLDTMAELKELAAAFPEEEWKKFTSKAKMKEYLIGKAKA